MSDFTRLAGIPGAIQPHPERTPSAIAVQDDQGPLRWLGLWSRAETLAQVLASQTDPGERVLLQFPPSADFAVAWLGTLLAGLVAVPVNPGATPDEIGWVRQDAIPALEITPAVLPGLEASPRRAAVAGPESDAAPAVILYTSGTTSRPKGVVHTHASVLANLAAIRDAWRWTAADHLVIAMPMYHTHGLLVGLTNALVADGTLSVLPRFDAEAVLDVIAARRATMFFGVPTMYARLVTLDEPASRWDLDSVRLWVSGSAPLPAEIFEQFEARYGQRLLERYGMTEAGMIMTNPYDGPRIPGSVGMPFPGMEARLADQDALGGEPPVIQDVPEGETGEILLRGASIFREYLNRPDATAEAFVDGWFRTGDLATRDTTGRYRIVGRASTDIIKSRGYKIGALEIEDVLARHPAVLEVAVIGVDDADWGEAICAVVALAPGRTATPDELRAFARESLASYKTPKHVVLVDEVPKTGPGKFRKRELLDRYRTAWA